MDRKKSPNVKFPSVEQAAGHEPGPTKARRKPPKKKGESFPLKLTQPQRETMTHATRIRSKIKERLREAGTGTQIVAVSRKELDHLNDELSQAAVYAPGADKKRLVAVHRQVSDFLAEELAGQFEGREKLRKSAPNKGELIYQFKVTLLDIKPAIWRRIQVPDCTLANLHEYIQTAFGWWNYHLHQFIINGEQYGIPDFEDFLDEDKIHDDAGVRLSKLIPKSGRVSRWIYEYDFGDDWRHEVLFEGYPIPDPKTKYPLCVDGARACPPEDCGGPWGYENYLAILADPGHEEHDEMIEWRGPFDPEAFDAKEATKEMTKVK